jgi:hypothetical protein
LRPNPVAFTFRGHAGRSRRGSTAGAKDKIE